MKLMGKLIENIQSAAEQDYPNEACGVIVKQGKRKYLSVHCRNDHYDPKSNFTVNPQDYVKATELGEVVGVWHTHTHGSSHPTQTDRISCNLHKMPWYILGVSKEDDQFTFDKPYLLTPESVSYGLLERPYIWGIFDCFSLVRDYYKQEFDIEIMTPPEYPFCEPDWYRHGGDYYREYYKEAGFVRLIDEDPEIGDVFVMQICSDVPNHAAIYVGDGLMLHHAEDRLSGRDVYGGYYYKHTVLHCRHKSKMNEAD